ncbi:MAG: hypothetical protein PUP92_40045, partial [Rhizonema sp. PD38]|nr:hypothetical protein [Rhizonema sp. PD38]
PRFLSSRMPGILFLRKSLIALQRSQTNKSAKAHGQILSEGNQRSYPTEGNPPAALAPLPNCPQLRTYFLFITHLPNII